MVAGHAAGRLWQCGGIQRGGGQMSLNAEQIGEIDRDVRQQLNKLKDEVLDERNALAFLSLLDLALFATRSLHRLWWREHRPRRLFSKIAEDELEDRRESLRYFASWKDDFPILHSWENRANERQEQMLLGLRNGPLKSKGRHHTDMRRFIEQVIAPAFAEIQHMSGKPKTSLEREIWRFPPRSYDNKKEWADLAVRWSCLKWSDQMKTPDSPLWELAKPERELERGKRKKEKIVDKRGDRQRNAHSTGRLTVEEREAFDAKAKQINEMRVTEANFKNELKAQIVAWLKSNMTH
jgi:hypothetical protein